jgi:hypothetical protein
LFMRMLIGGNPLPPGFPASANRLRAFSGSYRAIQPQSVRIDYFDADRIKFFDLSFVEIFSVGMIIQAVSEKKRRAEA